MKTFMYVIVIIFPLVINAKKPHGLVDGNNQFSFGLYNEIKSNSNDNLFYSPFSISTAMAMVYAGARNETALQISKTLKFPADEKFHSDYKRLLTNLDEGAKGSIQLNIANCLWAQKDFKFLDSYFDQVLTNYNSELKNVDFIDPAEREKTRHEINLWVAQKTNERIQDILAPGTLTDRTRLVLVNAIYFYGDWAYPFEKHATSPKDFILIGGSKYRVPFMNQKKSYRYYEDDNIKAIEIPYKDDKACMMIILPHATDGITILDQSFNEKFFRKISDEFTFEQVHLSLPKFETTYEISLGETLSDMGMPRAFSDLGADFSGMTGKRDLYISDVIHKAFIKVDEKGTEAAAATAVVMEIAIARPQSDIKIFNADHPFIFCIKDNTTGSILFMGRMMKPEVEN